VEACQPDRRLTVVHGDEAEKKERPPYVVFCAVVPNWGGGGGGAVVEVGQLATARAVGMLKADVDILEEDG
jgi:hypothetical protein